MIATTSKLCRAKPLQPALGDLCGTIGVPGVATRAERFRWAALAKDDCQALRAFLTEFPDGPFTVQAERRLARRTNEISKDWTRRGERVNLQYERDGQGFADRTAAIDDAFARSRRSALSACMPDGIQRRTTSASIANARPKCRTLNGTSICALDYDVVCHVEIRKFVEVCR
jgi:hypothetical protein